MVRVAVIGNAGGGKSTLCRALSAARGLPHFAVDQIQWQPGWVPVPEAQVSAAHDEILAGTRWIIDGFGPWDAIKKRLDVADTIIFVDHPLWLHYWWATKRQVTSALWGRVDGPEGCPMLPVTFRLYKMMWTLHWQTRPALQAAIDSRGGDTTVHHIRSPKELAAFRARYC